MNSTRGKMNCSDCEQRLLEKEDPSAALRDAWIAGHLASCGECTEFFEALQAVKPVLDRYRVEEPAEALLEEVVGRSLERLFRVPAPARAGLFRLLLAGIVSLPVVILINALMGWAVYEVAVSLLPRTVAWYLVGLFAAWASLAVSLGYASLPLLDALVRKPPARLPAAAGP